MGTRLHPAFEHLVLTRHIFDHRNGPEAANSLYKVHFVGRVDRMYDIVRAQPGDELAENTAHGVIGLRIRTHSLRTGPYVDWIGHMVVHDRVTIREACASLARLIEERLDGHPLTVANTYQESDVPNWALPPTSHLSATGIGQRIVLSIYRG